jgi:excisionase family DNA binding protein
MASPNPELFSTDQAASYLAVSPSTLEIWRCTRRYDIPYVKIGRKVRYRRTDLDDWLEARTQRRGSVGDEA